MGSTHIVVPKIGQKCGSVSQKALQLLLADVAVYEGFPVTRAGSMELDYEVEDCLGLWRHLLKDGSGAVPSGSLQSTWSAKCQAFNRSIRDTEPYDAHIFVPSLSSLRIAT